jgi:hypothetical protein
MLDPPTRVFAYWAEERVKREKSTVLYLYQICVGCAAALALRAVTLTSSAYPRFRYPDSILIRDALCERSTRRGSTAQYDGS